MHPFILFEGIDHTGKTTISTRLAERFGGFYLHTPPEELKAARPFFDSLDFQSNLAYYLTGNHLVAYAVQQNREDGPVFLDRYFYSTVAFHSARMGVNLDNLLERMAVVPDRIFFLTADVDESLRRMGITGDSRAGFHERELLAKMSANYDRLFSGNPSVLEIDTTERSLEDVYSQVLEDVTAFLKR
ncbi:hypothetical protein KY359_00810 [Candidatus Woesearchaeota archaeon]|nr:hypothetical protein [Candidatus Woesearchaeota archaeon]